MRMIAFAQIASFRFDKRSSSFQIESEKSNSTRPLFRKKSILKMEFKKRVKVLREASVPLSVRTATDGLTSLFQSDSRTKVARRRRPRDSPPFPGFKMGTRFRATKKESQLLEVIKELLNVGVVVSEIIEILNFLFRSLLMECKIFRRLKFVFRQRDFAQDQNCKNPF